MIQITTSKSKHVIKKTNTQTMYNISTAHWAPAPTLGHYTHILMYI